MLTPKEMTALRYLAASDADRISVDVDSFDWQFWPIGARLRRELAPTHMSIGPNDRVLLTEAGRRALQAHASEIGETERS